MNVPEITDMKINLERLCTDGLLTEWELPYENLLTRLSAAQFFVSIKGESEENLNILQREMSRFDNFHIEENSKKNLSKFGYKISFEPKDDLEPKI